MRRVRDVNERELGDLGYWCIGVWVSEYLRGRDGIGWDLGEGVAWVVKDLGL